MSLEKRVKEFAERARQILLAQAAADRENKEGKGTWQGYGADGRGQVKKDGETKPVNIIGEISLPTNADVFLDSTDSIEIQKATPKTPPSIPIPKVTTKIEAPVKKSRPIAIDDFIRQEARPNFIPFYVIRWNDSSFNQFTLPQPIPGPQFFSRQTEIANGVSTTFTDDRVTLDFRGRDDTGHNFNLPQNTLLLHHTRYSQYYTDDEQRQFFMAARHFLNNQPNAMRRTDLGSGTPQQPTGDRNFGAVNVGSGMTNIVFLMAHTWLPLYSNIGSQQPGGTGVPLNSTWAGDGVPAVLETHITSPGTSLPYSAQNVGFMVGHCILATDDFETWQIWINDGDSSQFGRINPIGNFNVLGGTQWAVQDQKSVTGPFASVDHTTTFSTFNSDFNEVSTVFTHTYP